MKIAGSVIIIPDEDPVCYALDWRVQIADLLTKAKGELRRIPRSLADDVWLAQMLKSRRYRDSKLKLQFEQLARWHESDVRYVFQAVLSTDVGLDIAARDLGVDEEQLTGYLRCYFDIRDEQGLPRPIVKMRLAAGNANSQVPAMFTALSRAAFVGGYELIKNLLILPSLSADLNWHERIQAVVNQEALKRVLAGEMNNADLARLLNTHIAFERMRRETEPANAQAEEAQRALLGIIQLVAAPRMIDSTPMTEEEIQRKTAALQSKMTAEGNVKQQEIVDKGRRHAEEYLRRFPFNK